MYITTPANIHMDRVVKELFGGYVKFSDYKRWVEENHPSYSEAYKYLMFDGRSRHSIHYESVNVDATTFKIIMKYGCNYDEIIKNMAQDVANMRRTIMRLTQLEETPKSLVDLAVVAILNGVDILKKYRDNG